MYRVDAFVRSTVHKGRKPGKPSEQIQLSTLTRLFVANLVGERVTLMLSVNVICDRGIHLCTASHLFPPPRMKHDMEVCHSATLESWSNPAGTLLLQFDQEERNGVPESKQRSSDAADRR